MQAANTQSILREALHHHKADRLKEAEALYRIVLQQDPAHPDALHLMGLLANQVGRVDVAIQLISRAIQVVGTPIPTQFLVNLSGIQLARGEAQEVEILTRNGLANDPNSSGLWNNLGNSLYLQGRISEAADCFKSAFDVDQTNAGALSNYANILQETGRISEAMAAHKHAVSVSDDKKAAEDNYLRDVGFMDDIDPLFVRSQHDQWGDAYEKSLDPASIRNQHKNTRDPNRAIKIGFISPDFRLHSVTYFMEPLLRHLDRQAVEVYCYANVARPDSTSERLQQYAIHWRNITLLTDPKAADMIEEDGIDILIDLAGHTSENRCRILALKPAPVQMTYLGYPFSTGLSACQYRISDEITDPVGLTESHYLEKLLRLPNSTWCFEPPTFQIPVAPSPGRKNGFVTFGSFNTYNKINDAVLDAWAEILKRLPDSRLLLKAHGFSDQIIRNQLTARLEQRGILATRLSIHGREPLPEKHLEMYSQIDIALDSFPYNGTTTTCEAMWQGVPVVVLAGNSHVARVGVCLNECLGLSQHTGQNISQYIDIAVNLAQDIDALREQRITKRERMQNSPLCDQANFARQFETLLIHAWKTYCDAPLTT